MPAINAKIEIGISIFITNGNSSCYKKSHASVDQESGQARLKLTSNLLLETPIN